MTDDELASVAGRLANPLPGAGLAIGAPGHFGSRIQPNSPGDDEEEILFSVLEGLACGCGDVIIGLNPASDDLETIVRLEQLLQGIVNRLELPTRYCVLSDIVKQHRASGRTHVDVGFQSLAGTSRALAGMVGAEGLGTEVYTAVTRAQERVRVVGTEAAVRAAVATLAQRATGLRLRLQDPAAP